MAYNPYYPGYMPTNQQQFYNQPVPDQLAQLRQNQMQQPLLQVTQQPQPMPATNPMIGSTQNGMIWVSGRQEADSYLIAPNSAVALWDQNNPVVYLRKADSTGKPSTIVYDLVERTDIPKATPQIDIERFVTWDKLDEYLAEHLKRPVKVSKAKEDTDNG